MSDKQDEHSEQQQSADLGGDPDVPVIPIPSPEHPHHSPIETRHSHHYIKRGIEFIRERWNSPPAWSAIASLVTAVATIVMVIVYVQIKGLMESSSGQTEKLIAAANTQAQAATSFSESAGHINQQIQNAVVDLGRPYVYVYPVAVGYGFEQIRAAWDQQIAREHKLSFTPTIFNLGISPAVHISASKPRVLVGSDAIAQADHCSLLYGKDVLNIVLPQQSQQRETFQDFSLQSVDTGTLTEDEIKKVIAGKDHIVAFGGIKYSGIRGGDFETRYCFKFAPTGMPYGSCGCVGMR